MSGSLLKRCVAAAVLAAGYTAATAQTPVSPAVPDTTVHPITSLPKAPDDPTNTATHPQPTAIASEPAASQPEPDQPAGTSVANPSASSSATPANFAAPASSAAPALDAAPASAAPASSVTVSTPETVPPAAAPSAAAPPPETIAPPSSPMKAMVAAPAPPPAHLVRTDVRPFRTFGVSVNVGDGGVGLQLATALSRTTNLRVGGDFFSLSKTLIENGLHYAGDLKLHAANANLDWFPFHGAFRISPGLTLYNGNNLNASVTAPGGQMFSLADQEYTSSPSDPVTGTASLSFGNRVAPQITAGFGNMIPRGSRHWSVPFEIGFQYIGQPLIQIHLQGTACTTYMGVYGCDNAATDPQIQANVQQEQNELNADIHQLRFYPVLRLGLSYKF